MTYFQWWLFSGVLGFLLLMLFSSENVYKNHTKFDIFISVFVFFGLCLLFGPVSLLVWLVKVIKS